MSDIVERQWPDNLCSGSIRYGKTDKYDGFYLADDDHGIPTCGSVSPTLHPTLRGQYVNVFNYPGQTEEIARRLVACWNACVGIPTDEITHLRAERDRARDAGLEEAAAMVDDTAEALRCRAKATRENWCGNDISQEDRASNFADARNDEKMAGIWARVAPAIRALISTDYTDRITELKAANKELVAALRCALAQLEADHDDDVAAEMFGGEPDPARAMNINRYDVAEMARAALAKYGEK